MTLCLDVELVEAYFLVETAGGYEITMSKVGIGYNWDSGMKEAW